MNNKVNFLRGTSTEYATSTKNNDTFYYTTDDEKLYLGNKEITGIEIDDTSTSETDKTWSAKKINDSIPTELPANGGNADTIDGLGTDVIPHGYQTLYDNADQCTKSGYYMLNSTALNIPIATFGLLIVNNGDYANADATWAVQTFYLTSNGDAYRRMYVNGKFTTWVNIADGGNADTLDSKHSSDFSQIISFGTTSTDTKTAIGIPCKTTAYWCNNWTDYPTELADGQGMIITANYNRSGTSVGVDNIWCRQIFISPHPNTKIYQRILSGTDIGGWINIADGGNAASVGGKTITVTDVDPGAGTALNTGEIVFVTEVT